MKALLVSCLSGFLILLCCLLFYKFHTVNTNPTHQVGAERNITSNGDFNQTKNETYEFTSALTTSKIPHRIPGKISEEMCKRYGESVYEELENPILMAGLGNIKNSNCKNHEKLIKGGMKADENEFPHMAIIGKYDDVNHTIEWFCGGSLISTRFILTAAHCNVTAGSNYAMLGTNVVEVNEKSLILGIEEVYAHPDYDKNKNDIALLKLGGEVNLTDSIRPACLDLDSELNLLSTTPNASKALSTGWGVDGEGVVNKYLHKVGLEITDEKNCSAIYPTEAFKFVPEFHICAGAEGKDSCQGDSGGPLQVSNKKVYCMYNLIGITSFGMNCSMNWSTNVPGVYTRVSRYIEWIEDIVWP